jgi:hypothetical protein
MRNLAPQFVTNNYSPQLTRYLDIMRSLHFVNNHTLQPTNKDRFSKFGIIMNEILLKFDNFVQPGEFICIDESLMPFKGRLSFKQYVPTKRARFGVKFFVLVDCATKVILRILPYQGKGTELDGSRKDFGVGGSVIMTMLKDGYLEKYHRLVADNWFSTPQLVKELLDKKTYFLGTTQKRRSGEAKSQMTAKLKMGEVQSITKDGILIERYFMKTFTHTISFRPNEVTFFC